MPECAGAHASCLLLCAWVSARAWVLVRKALYFINPAGLMLLDPIKTRHLFRLGTMACGDKLDLVGTWPDADQEELKAALKHKKDDERAGKEKKQRKNKRIDAREAAFVKEVKRGDEPMRKLVTVRKRLTMSE